MKSILLFLLSFQLTTGFIQAEATIITLDHGFTWKAMFDAGFRPLYTGDGTYKCRQLNVHVKIRKQEGGEVLDLGIGDTEFSLHDDHLLVLVAFYGREYRTVPEVERKTEVFAQILGDAIRKKSKITWFETEHSVDYGERKIDSPRIIREVNDKDALNSAKIGDLSICYSFQSGSNIVKSMVERFSFSLGSPQAYRASLLKTKIQPPIGYEHISLEPNEVLKSQGMKMNSEDLSNPLQANGRERIARKPGVILNKQKNTHTNFLWLWFFLIPLAMSAWFLRKKIAGDG
jgi:hypothetical protein